MKALLEKENRRFWNYLVVFKYAPFQGESVGRMRISAEDVSENGHDAQTIVLNIRWVPLVNKII